ncbi:MAG: hypothetical protein WAW90_02130 [Minisyncoccia bacterium]
MSGGGGDGGGGNSRDGATGGGGDGGGPAGARLNSGGIGVGLDEQPAANGESHGMGDGTGPGFDPGGGGGGGGAHVSPASFSKSGGVHVMPFGVTTPIGLLPAASVQGPISGGHKKLMTSPSGVGLMVGATGSPLAKTIVIPSSVVGLPCEVVTTT